MAVLVDTTTVAPEERFALWTETSRAAFEPITLTRASDRPFTARLARHRLGPVSLDHMRADASYAIRTPDLIRDGDPEEVNVLLQLRGRCSVEQDRRAAVVRPGDITCWHSSHPYVVGSDGAFEVLMLRVPSQLLGGHADRLGRRAAEQIDGRTRLGRLTKRHLLDLAAGLEEDDFDEHVRVHLADGALALVRALYAAADEEHERAARSASARLRAEIHRYIECHLGDPGLTPTRIADAHYISRSYLNKLFERQETGVQATIKARRLERSRRDLADPGLVADTVFDIASRWGFRSPSHFSRSFRAAYGCSPVEFRARMLGA